jgi:hypothetical protein
LDVVDGVVVYLVTIGQQALPLAMFVGSDGGTRAVEEELVLALEVTFRLDLLQLPLGH